MGDETNPVPGQLVFWTSGVSVFIIVAVTKRHNEDRCLVVGRKQAWFTHFDPQVDEVIA